MYSKQGIFQHHFQCKKVHTILDKNKVFFCSVRIVVLVVILGTVILINAIMLGITADCHSDDNLVLLSIIPLNGVPLSANLPSVIFLNVVMM